MRKVTIQSGTTHYPLSLVGREAAICYGADISNEEKNKKRGIDCLKSEHGRTLEFPQIYLTLEGYSARVIRELYTHIGGAPTRLSASTRYIDYQDFEYVTPPSIADNKDRAAAYTNTMKYISGSMKLLEALGTPREDLAMLLPLGMTQTCVIRTNLRQLIDMSHQRLCTRANHEFQQLMRDILNELCEYSEEWKYIVTHYCVPKCEYLGRCPESHSCGRFSKKEQLNELAGNTKE